MGNFDIFSISEECFIIIKALGISILGALFGGTGSVDASSAILQVSGSNSGTEKLIRLVATKYYYLNQFKTNVRVVLLTGENCLNLTPPSWKTAAVCNDYQ